MGTNEADLFPYHRIWSGWKTQSIEEFQAINYAWCNALLLKPEYCSGVCGCIVDKPVREKKHLRARLAAHKNICQRFRDFKIAWKLYVGFCLHYREKLHSDFSLQPSGNIFGLKIVMSCSVVRQQRNKVGRDHMWITDYWHMTKCQEGHSGINFLYNKIKKRVEKIFLQSFFAISRSWLWQ